MNLDKEKEVDLVKLVTYLRRISYHQYPDSTLKELIFDKIRYLLIGDEIEIYNSLVSWVADGNILGKEINYIKVKEFLDNNNIQLRNLTLDKRIQPQIDELNDEYEQRFPMIRNNLIIRKEFFECRKMIELGESSVIYGKAGRGKSGCTIDLVNYCKSKKIPYLAIKLDNHVPSRNAEEWAKEIGLPGSIPDCIDSISMNQRAVIILDQLDALRWTQNHSRESIVVCEQIIKQVAKLNLERKYNISIFFVCRSYDLENDNNISSLFIKKNEDKNSIKWNKIEVTDLDNEIVSSIVGTRYNKLTGKLKELLKVPSNLYIWEQLDHSKNYVECTSTNHLVKAWWDQLSQKCFEFNLNDSELENIKTRIVGWLEKNGRIFFPVAAIRISKPYLDFLSSNSFLVIQENKGFFAHQSILDCFLAEELYRRYYDGDNLVEVIGAKSNQTPGKKYQLQIFLEMLLEYDTKDFLKASRQLFESNRVRFFLKFIFLEILGQIENPDKDISKFIIMNCENPVYSDYLIKNVLMGNPQYIQVLRQNEKLGDWVNQLELRKVVLDLMTSISPKYSEGDIEFIRSNFLVSPNAINQMVNFFPYDLNKDTDELFELRMEFYNKYSGKISPSIYFKNITENSEMRVVRILEFLLKDNSQKQLSYRDANDLIDSDSEIFINRGREVLDILIPLIPTEKSVNFRNWDCTFSGNNGLERLCIEIVKKANRNIIDLNPDLFWDIYKKFMGRGYTLFNEIILDGFIYLPKKYSDQIIESLLTNINGSIFVSNVSRGNKLTLIKQVLSKHTKYCNQQNFDNLQDKIYKYLPENAINTYRDRINFNKRNSKKVYWAFSGELQKEILEVLPQERISEKCGDMIKVLERKFPKGTRYNQRERDVIRSIGTPLSGKRLSDNQWLNLLTNKKIKNRDISSWINDFVDNSISGYSQNFKNAVSKNPNKFIELFIQHKESILPDYVDPLFNGVAYSPKIEGVPTQLLEKMILTFSYNNNPQRAKDICEIIQKKSGKSWSTSIIDVLQDIANMHENPEFYQNIINSDTNADNFDALQNASINCVEGAASLAIKKILSDDRSLLEKFKQSIEVMIFDKNIIVKMAACFALVPAYNIDKEWSEENIIKLYSQDYRFAGIFEMKSLLFKLYPDNRNLILSIILDCYNSDDKSLKVIGAHCLCEMYILNHEFEDVFKNIDEMDDIQFKEIINMTNRYFNVEGYNDISKKILLDFKNSKKEIEIPISLLFHHHSINLERDKDFLMEIMDIGITGQSIYSFVRYLEEEAISVVNYKDIILSMCSKIINNRNTDTGHYIDNEISKLIIGLYDETINSDPEVASQCLELWDLMYKYQIGSIRRLSKELMER